MKGNVTVGYDSDDKCIIPVDKFSHFVGTLPASYMFQQIGFSCYNDSVDLSMLYEAMNKTKRLDL